MPSLAIWRSEGYPEMDSAVGTDSHSLHVERGRAAHFQRVLFRQGFLSNRADRRFAAETEIQVERDDKVYVLEKGFFFCFLQFYIPMVLKH